MNANNRNDLLLDALSCIDDDILEKGLEQRAAEMAEGAGQAAASTKAATEASTDATTVASVNAAATAGVTEDDRTSHAGSAPRRGGRPAPDPRFLMDLSASTVKPARTSKRRIGIVAAVVAASLLLAVLAIPTGFMLAKRAEADSNTGGGTSEINSDKSWSDLWSNGWWPFSSFLGDALSPSPDRLEEQPAIGEQTSWNIEVGSSVLDLEPAPDASEPGISFDFNPESTYTPVPLAWEYLSSTNGCYQLAAKTNSGIAVSVTAVIEDDSDIDEYAFIDPNAKASERSQNAVRLLAQNYLSQATLDYASHFASFQLSFVADRVLSQVSDLVGQNNVITEDDYEKVTVGLAEIASRKLAFDSVDMNITICKAYSLGQDVPSRLEASLTKVGLDAERISEVYYFVAEGGLTINDSFHTSLDMMEVYMYRFDNREWSLDPELLDDDLSVDLIQSCLFSSGNTYFETTTVTGTVTEILGDYLFMEDMAFFIGGLDMPAVSVGDTVLIEAFHNPFTLDRTEREGALIESVPHASLLRATRIVQLVGEDLINVPVELPIDE